MSLIQKNDYDPPKSYVLRKGRITKAQKRALTNLKNLYVLPIETKKIDFTKEENVEKFIVDAIVKEFDGQIR